MAQGDKSKYTDKQIRKAEHIAESYEERGVPEKEAEARAWATVNKDDGGGKKPGGSGRGKATGHPAAHIVDGAGVSRTDARERSPPPRSRRHPAKRNAAEGHRTSPQSSLRGRRSISGVPGLGGPSALASPQRPRHPERQHQPHQRVAEAVERQALVHRPHRLAAQRRGQQRAGIERRVLEGARRTRTGRRRCGSARGIRQNPVAGRRRRRAAGRSRGGVPSASKRSDRFWRAAVAADARRRGSPPPSGRSARHQVQRGEGVFQRLVAVVGVEIAGAGPAQGRLGRRRPRRGEEGAIGHQRWRPAASRVGGAGVIPAGLHPHRAAHAATGSAP